MFRKKPIVIEAVQFDGTIANIERLQELAGDKIRLRSAGDCILTIPTLEGDMFASKDDWIIKGVAGEIYPCKPDIFEQTYEPA